MSMLDILRRNADAIRQAEMGALLHDLDKMDPDFLSVGPTYHDCKDKGKRAGKTVREIKRQRWESMFGNVDPEIRFDGLELPLLSCADPDVTIDPGFPGSLSSAFVYHHHNDRDTFPLLGMICHAGGCGADGIDSELDKDKANEKQSAPFRIDTPFGVLQKEWSSCLKEAIDTVLRGERRPRRFRGLLASALGETRWPCNDVTLWAHSFSVASLFKATLAKILIEVTQGGFTKEHPYLLPRRYDRRRADPPENDTTDFAFFRVTIDRDFMLSRAQKAGDVVGMVDQVERLRDELRDYFEAEVLAGNEIQRTQDSQLFLIPNLGTWIENGECVLPRDVQDRFEEEIKTDLSTFIVKWLMENECHELPFSIDFDHETMPAGNDAKVVSKRLLARSQALQQHIPECRQSVPALLALKPGNGLRCEVCGVRAIAPNPQHKDEALCAPCGKRRHDRDLLKRRNPRDAHFTSDLSLVQPGKGEHNKLVLFHLRFDLASIQDGTVFDKVTWNGNTKAASPGRLHRAYETLAGFLAHCRDEIAPRWCSSPVFSITLEPTPDCMEFIVAGEKADALAAAIYDEYERRFGKFRECLPLSIGCVLFKKKFPLYAVLDAVRGMEQTLRPSPSCTWQVVGTNTATIDHVSLELQTPEQGKIGGMAGWAKWEISPLRSDGTTDACHPVFGDKNVTVSELKPGDAFDVREGRFDVLFLDSATRRFAFSENGLQHHILGTRPSYPLSAIRDFDRIWNLLRKLSHSQISAIEGALVEKMQQWGERWWSGDEEQHKVVIAFCAMILFSPNAFGKKPKGRSYTFLDADSNQDPRPENCDRELLTRAASSGLLLDVVDLYIHLENRSLGSSDKSHTNDGNR